MSEIFCRKESNVVQPLEMVNIYYRHFCKGKMPVFKNIVTLEKRRDISVNITEFSGFLCLKCPDSAFLM